MRNDNASKACTLGAITWLNVGGSAALMILWKRSLDELGTW
jgi:hypothetical protein